MNGRPYTDEHDRWLTDNVSALNWDISRLVGRFNSHFGEYRSEDSIRKHLRLICAPSVKYTAEMDEWLSERWFIPRADLTRMFNREFGCSRSVKAVTCRCQRIGAARIHLAMRENRIGNEWTEEMDGWLRSNARAYRHRFHDLYLDLNHRFGTNFCERAVHTRCERLRVNMKNYTEEEDAWLMAHKDTGRAALVAEFNREFGERRTLPSLQAHMRRLGAFNANARRNGGTMKGDGYGDV